jgi:hypothetical protein
MLKRVIALLVVAAGCAFDSDGSGHGASLGVDPPGDTGDMVNTSDGESTLSDSSATDGADASSASAGTSTTASTSTTAESSTSQGEETTGSPSDTGEETGPKPLQEEYLANGDHDTCTQPLWCYSGSIDNPTGTAFDAQDCFTATLTPPFEITHLHYTVANAGATPVGMMVEVREPSGSQPGNVVQSWNLSPQSSMPGSYVFELPEPLLWSSTSFCAGVSVPSGTSTQAVGMAVDTMSPLAGVSWLRVFGGSGCDIPNWADATLYNPSGNWCIAATIRETP